MVPGNVSHAVVIKIDYGALFKGNDAYKYDSARKAADSLPRQGRGSAANLARVAAVANALRAVKVGK